MGIHLKQVVTLDADGRILSDLGTPSVSTDASTKGYVDQEIAAPTSSDKAQNPAATSGDNEDSTIDITTTPARDSYVQVLVNGASVELGDGSKLKDCYFSSDGGTTARDISDITAGDSLYWNGDISTYDLAASDEIDLSYDVANTGSAKASEDDPGTFIALLNPDLLSTWISTTQTTYATVDVSEAVPPGSTAVMIRFYTTPGGTRDVYARHPDNTSDTVNEIVTTHTTGLAGRVHFIVPINANREFEARYSGSTGGANNNAVVVGYYVKTRRASPVETTFADGDTTPSVYGLDRFATAHTGATSVTDFDSGTDGQRIEVRIGDANTTFVHGAGVLELQHGHDVLALSGDLWVFQLNGSVWEHQAAGAGMAAPGTVMLRPMVAISGWIAATQTTYATVDVSAYIPIGAKHVIIDCHQKRTVVTGFSVKFRHPDDALNSSIQGTLAVNGGLENMRTRITQGVNAAAEFEATMSANVGGVTANFCYVSGYIKY